MKVLIEYIAEIEDMRQPWKVKYPIDEIIIIVLFAMLGNANEWEEIEGFAKIHEKALKKHLSLTHDTIQRVMGMISAESLQNIQNHWNELLSSNEILLEQISIKNSVITIDAIGIQIDIAALIIAQKGIIS